MYKEAMQRGEDQRLLQGMRLPEMQSGDQLERDIRAFQEELNRKIEGEKEEEKRARDKRKMEQKLMAERLA